MKTIGIYNLNKNINFGTTAKSIKPEEIRNAEGFVRKNMYGLQREMVDYFTGTKQINLHQRTFPSKNGNPGRQSNIDYAKNDSKEIKGIFYDSKFYRGELAIKTVRKNYNSDKKLVSKLQEYHSKDQNGAYLGEIETIYYPDGKTPKEVHHKKFHKYIDENGWIRNKLSQNITTSFNEKGIRTTKTEATSYESKTTFFDSTGKNVIDTKTNGTDSGISYYGQFGYYTPKTGMQMYTA